MSYAPAHSSADRRRVAGRLHMSWSRRSKLAASVVGALMAGGVAFAATTWTVGLGANSSSQAQSGASTGITIAAVASPTPGTLLYPGSTGDVVAKITNSNSFMVGITALQLPANTSGAVGYSDSGLTTAQSGCTATTSAVTFVGSTTTSGTTRTLSSTIYVAGNSNVTVVFTAEAAMGASSDNSCQSTYFKMPSFTGVTAAAGTGTATAANAAFTWA